MKDNQREFETQRINDNLQMKWGWFVVLGLLLVVLGLVAFTHLLTATVISAFYLGVLIAAAGLFQIVYSFQLNYLSGFLYFFLSGLLYGYAGVLAFQNPLFTAGLLTLLLALALIAAGIVRIWSGFILKTQAARRWVISSGSITLIVGIIFLMGWPSNSPFLLGMVLAVDLTYQGFSSIGSGVALKNGEFTSKMFRPENTTT